MECPVTTGFYPGILAKNLSIDFLPGLPCLHIDQQHKVHCPTFHNGDTGNVVTTPLLSISMTRRKAVAFVDMTVTVFIFQGARVYPYNSTIIRKNPVGDFKPPRYFFPVGDIPIMVARRKLKIQGAVSRYVFPDFPPLPGWVVFVD